MLGIIIPTKDDTKHLFPCLRSIVKSTSTDYRIYIADTGSIDSIKDQTKELLTELFENGKVKFIEYDYYNFSKINNDVVRNHIDDDIDVLVFCNNDIKIGVVGLLDRIYQMVIGNRDIIGTCGCRLLYPNKSIQHDGQVFRIANDNDNSLIMTHDNLRKCSVNVNIPKAKTVDGNTFALCAVLKSTFKDLGMLPEGYNECFEDVQFNMECRNQGLKNILLESNYWAYHHESATRIDSDSFTPEKLDDYMRVSDYALNVYTIPIKRLDIDI